MLLFAIILDPLQTPLESVVTQVPFSLYWPLAHTMQSFDVGPLQVVQLVEHAAQAVPLLKLPSGQTVPVLVVDCGAMHCVRSFAFWVKPVLHVRHSPLPSAHCVHPRLQTAGERQHASA